jgi:hypothetical protein
MSGKLPPDGPYEEGIDRRPWLGPVGFIGGTSPYLDWYLEKYYLHRTAWAQ